MAPKSKQPRHKTVLDEFGERHVVDVVRYYCQNPGCAYHTFTHFPPGVLPHSQYPVQVRLLAAEVYETLLSTYRRSARLFDVRAATLYHWVNALSPAAECFAAYLGVVRTSGVVGVDDKYILVCSPSVVRPHGRRTRAVWRYAYFAVDVYSYDLLALKLYPEHSDEAARLILLELKAKGLRPRVVASDQGITSTNGAAVSFTTITPTINAAFTHSPATLIGNGTATFTSTAITNGTPLTYAWAFGDGTTGTGLNATHAYTQPGTYTVTLTATDGCGFAKSSSASNAVTVQNYRVLLPLVRRG